MAFSKLLLAAILPAFVAAQNLPIPGTAGVSQCDFQDTSVCQLRTSATTTVTAQCVRDPQKLASSADGQCGYVGSACTADNQCQTSGTCLFPLGSDQGGQCRGYFGDPCGEYLGCLGFMGCGTVADAGTYYPACGGKGALCTQDTDCASGTCTENACTETFSRSVGSPCGNVSNLNGANGYCGSGLSCDALTNTCQPAGPAPTVESRRRAIEERKVAERNANMGVF